MVLTVTEDTPADMLAGSMELLVQLPRDHRLHTQKVTVLRSTPMMDLLVQIATAHKLTASSYTLQAIGERGLVLPHHPNTPIGALDALQVKLLPKLGTCAPRKTKQANQPFETTFRLQVHLPRNQLYVSRVSPKMNLGEILDEVCREKNLDRSKYELRHPANLEDILDLSLSLQDYHLQEVTLYAKQTRGLGPTLSTQDIMALQRQEERRRQQTKQSVFGFMFKKSKENSLSTDSLGGRSVSPARSDETARSASPLQPPTRPQRKRRPAPKPPGDASTLQDVAGDSSKDKMMINHSRNSSDSSGYHEASVLSDNPDSAARLPETLPRRSRAPGTSDNPRKLAQTSQSSKSLGNLAATSDQTLSRGISNTSLSSTGLRKKRAAPPPPAPRPLSSAISTQALERIVDSEESLTSDMDPSKPPSDIGAPSKASSDIDCPKANSDIGVCTQSTRQNYKPKAEAATCESDGNIQQNCTAEMNVVKYSNSDSVNNEFVKMDTEVTAPKATAPKVEQARVAAKRVANRDIPSETDVLLQKVSDTLSSVLPATSSSVLESALRTNHVTATEQQTNVVDVLDNSAIKSEIVETKIDSNEIPQSCIDFPVGNILSTSTPNMTAMDSQQDTSDYVSAMGEDLSITDWEYQLPAPPSAFRDSHSPTLDDYDTITLGSVDAFKEQLVNCVPELADTAINDDESVKSAKNPSNNFEGSNQISSNRKTNLMSETEINVKQTVNKPAAAIVKQSSVVSHKSEIDSDLRKEIISELENKIETGNLAQTTVNKDFDRRNMDNLSTPNIAPVDNTLSNFTITTYTKQKSVDIFGSVEEFEESAKNSEERFIKTFATLSRNNGDMGNHNKQNATKNIHLINEMTHDKKAASKYGQLHADNNKTEPKISDQDVLSHKLRNAVNEKINIQRSKSYISMSSNAKYQTETQGIGKKKYEVEPEIAGSLKKATSITDLNVDVLASKNEKWRDNMLKQKEPTKEKPLRSLQVLKSILPQLKNVQQAEENVSKEYNNTLLIEKPRYEAKSNEHSTKMNIVSTHESRDLEPECKRLPREENTKRYTYTGPPAISLGSWSERPSVNVQIKMDTDYKLGTSNTNNNKTVVNINGAKNEKNPVNCASNIGKNNFANNNPDELARKLVTHTKTSSFKLPVSNQVNAFDLTKNEDKPVVMGVELKKVFVETSKETSKNDENEIDTTPVNFRELTKTFGQHVNLKPKPKRININRHSADYHDVPSETERITNIKQNGHAKFPKASNQNEFSFKVQSLNDTRQNSRVKRFTSVVGLNGTNQSLGLQNDTSFKDSISNVIKINPSVPTVKGFKIPAVDPKTNTNHNRLSTIDNSNRGIQPPKPPTMPVITGVTLKSANTRPKSMPIQLDPRNMLLESIRNFGGREKLKSTAEKY